MALTTSERHDIRYGSRLGYKKATIDAAAEAVLSQLTSPAIRGVLGGAIDGATQPLGVQFTASEKKKLIAYVLRALFGQEKDG